MMDRPNAGNAISMPVEYLRSQSVDIVHEQWRREGGLGEDKPTKSDLIKDAVEVANRLLRLPHGWDGKNARRVDPTVALTMVRFIESLIDDGSPDAQLSPLPDGGLVAEWLVGDDSVEVRVHPGLRWSIWAERADGVDEVEASFERPEQGRAAIEQARIFLSKMGEHVRVRRPRSR
jgi:hypothetical protein